MGKRKGEASRMFRAPPVVLPDPSMPSRRCNTLNDITARAITNRAKQGAIERALYVVTAHTEDYRESFAF